jgi:hypothetical protein
MFAGGAWIFTHRRFCFEEFEAGVSISVASSPLSDGPLARLFEMRG